MSASQNHTGSGHNIHVEGDFVHTLPKFPFLLSDIINVLSREFVDTDSSPTGELREIAILDKIQYNNLARHHPFIKELSIYQGKIEEIYSEIDALASGKKTMILQNIRTTYLRERTAILVKHQTEGMPEIDCIRNHADIIFGRIADYFIGKVEASANLTAPHDAVSTAVYIVMVDAFIRCKILEAPVKLSYPDGTL